ncbi:MAG: 7TM-DISM domain-containing protein [Leptospiraceae bacterium]|nr:7TM-DISM domain-containing protein [Leptospiraceae bacterium]
MKIILFLMLSFSINAESILLEDKKTNFDIGNNLYYQFEGDRPSSIEDISEEKRNKQFKKNFSKTLEAGYSKNPVWIHFKVKDLSNYQDDWILEIGYSQLDEIVFYYYDNEWKKIVTGDKFPFSNRNFRHRFFLLPLKLNKGKEHSFYIKVSTTTSIIVPLKIYTLEESKIQENRSDLWNIFLLVYSSLIIFIAIYKSFRTLNAEFILIGLSTFNFLMYLISFNGYGYMYIWKNSPYIQSIAIPFFICLFAISSGELVIRFLNLKKENFFSYTLIKFLQIIVMLNIIGVLFESFYTVRILNIIGMLNTIIHFLTSSYLWSKGKKYLRFFVIGSAIFTTLIFLIILKFLGLLDTAFFPVFFIQAGYMVSLGFILASILEKERTLVL